MVGLTLASLCGSAGRDPHPYVHMCGHRNSLVELAKGFVEAVPFDNCRSKQVQMQMLGQELHV